MTTDPNPDYAPLKCKTHNGMGGAVTTFTTLTCLVALFACGWQVATGRGLLACVGIAGAGLLLIDLGSREEKKP